MVDALLKDDNDLRQENIEHVITKEQIHMRMQMLTTECNKLKQHLVRVKKTSAEQKAADAESYANVYD